MIVLENKIKIADIVKDLDIYVYCKLGKRALIGMTYAQRAGYTNRFVIMSQE